MRKTLACGLIALSLLGVSGSPAQAAKKAGDTCAVAGKVINVAGVKLVCTKLGKNLKWVLVPVATTTTTVAVTTTIATTTTVAGDRTAPIVTLARFGGTSTSPTLSFTVTGNESINCATLSPTSGVDFTFTRISGINSITQTSTTVCTISAQSTAERGDTEFRASILTAASTFSITDSAGNAQTTLLGSPQQIWVKRDL